MVSKEALVIGALLYDIGKFEFRASNRREHHTTYGDFFVDEYLRRFRCMQPILADIRRLVAHHHEKESDPFLREADHWAAQDRQIDGSPETLRSLVSVLTSVEIGKGGPPPEVYRYVPGPVNFADPFPKPDREQVRDEHTHA